MPLTRDQIDDLLRAPFLFREQAQPSPGELRPVWRVPYVLLLVRTCWGGRATHEQLHVLNWAVRSTEGEEALAMLASGYIDPGVAAVRYEPALDRAVALATGLGLLLFQNKRWSLTDSGKELLEQIDADDALLARPKELVARLGSPLTQTAVHRLLGRERAS